MLFGWVLERSSTGWQNSNTLVALDDMQMHYTPLQAIAYTSNDLWCSNGLNLDDSFPRKLGGLDACTGWFRRRDESLVDLVHGGKVAHVHEVDCQRYMGAT